MTGQSPDAEADTPSAPDLRVFAYAIYEKSELYLAILDVIVAAKERFRLQLRPAEITRHLTSVDEPEVAEALDRLEGWGNLTRFYDTAAPETLAEFYSKRFLYQLTPAGAAAHEGVRAVRASGLASAGRLSAVLLPAIIERLQAIKAEVDDPAEAVPDPAKLYTLLVDLFGGFAELADNASRYMTDLAVETSIIAGDDESFASYKKAVLAYLNEFVARLTDLVPRVAALIIDLDSAMPSLLASAAAADVAPSRDGNDEGPLRSFELRWAGVRDWFVPRHDEQPVAESLRAAMLDALSRILFAVSQLNERHLRRVSREADFTQLARWFAQASIDDEAAALWDVAFGLYPARHFTDLAGNEEINRNKSFWDSEPATIAPRLRASGKRSGPGRPGREADYGATKRSRLAQLRAQHRQAEIAAQRLSQQTPARLSDLAELDPAEFAQFLAVVDAALAAPPRPDGSRQAVTPLVNVTLRPTNDGVSAQVRAATGTLTMPDHVLEIGLARRAAKAS